MVSKAYRNSSFLLSSKRSNSTHSRPPRQTTANPASIPPNVLPYNRRACTKTRPVHHSPNTAHCRKAELLSRTSNRNLLLHSRRNHKALSKPKRPQIPSPSRYLSPNNLGSNNSHKLSPVSLNSLSKEPRANKVRSRHRLTNKL